MGCHFLLQGIFPTQGLNLGLPHCGQTLYPLSHQGRDGVVLINLAWVVITVRIVVMITVLMVIKLVKEVVMVVVVAVEAEVMTAMTIVEL